MRLTDIEMTAIRETAVKTFGIGVSVWLFGSRVDDSKRGGDIDLLIITETDQSRIDILKKETDFLVTLKNIIGEQKVDLLVATVTNLTTDPFLRTIANRIPLSGTHAIKMSEVLFETSCRFIRSLGGTSYTASLDDYLIFSDGRIVALVEIAKMDQSGEFQHTAPLQETSFLKEQSTPADHIGNILTQQQDQIEKFKLLVLLELKKEQAIR